MVNHFIPTSIKEALEYIHSHPSTLISGGTDIMVQRRNWAELPPLLTNDVVYLFNIEEMKLIFANETSFTIGANVPVAALLEHPATPDLLRQAIEIIASPALRNMATIAGNIGNASPAGDTLPILYVLDALVKIESLETTRIAPIQDVIIGPRKTTIKQNEMITQIIIPNHSFTTTVFHKIGGRKADAISKISFTGAARIEEGIVKDLRIAFGAVAPVVERDRAIEVEYMNMPLAEVKSKVNDIKNQYKSLIRPIDDQRSNKKYRTQVALNLLEQFIIEL